jgi:DNA replication protein DnaC
MVEPDAPVDGGYWWPGRWCPACEAAWVARRHAAKVADGQADAGIPARYRAHRFPRHLIQAKGETWDAFRTRLEAEAEATIGITGWNVRVARAIRDRPKGRTLIVSGPVGSGKSLLTSALATDMIERGIPVAWITEPELWEAHAREQLKGAARRVVGLTMGAPLLFLDDLGATEKLTAWHRDHLEALICGRYDRGASLVITTNLPLTAPEKQDSIASMYGERVLSRLVEMVGGRRAGLPGYLELRGMDWRSDVEHPPTPAPEPSPASSAPPASSSTTTPRARDWKARQAGDDSHTED